MNAVGRFDPERGNRFTRYLTPFLRGALASLWKEKNIVQPLSNSEEFPTFTSYEEGASGDGREKSRKQLRAVEMVPATDEAVADAEELNLNLAFLSKCKAKLTDEEKKLLHLIYEGGVSMADIARERKVSRQAVHAAHGQIIEKIRASFKREGRR